MSRFEWDDYGDPPEYSNAAELFEARARQAIYGKPGRAALRELREALMALPRHELIEGAVCRRRDLDDEELLPAEVIPIAPGQQTLDGSPPGGFVTVGQVLVDPVHAIKIEGVCAIGAWVWWKKVKAGTDPVVAFTELPALDTADEGDVQGDEMFETAWLGAKNGLTYTLAWELASGNDETFAGLEPAVRWQRFIGWIDAVLASPSLKRGEKAPGERLGHSWSA